MDRQWVHAAGGLESLVSPAPASRSQSLEENSKIDCGITENCSGAQEQTTAASESQSSLLASLHASRDSRIESLTTARLLLVLGDWLSSLRGRPSRRQWYGLASFCTQLFPTPSIHAHATQAQLHSPTDASSPCIANDLPQGRFDLEAYRVAIAKLTELQEREANSLDDGERRNRSVVRSSDSETDLEADSGVLKLLPSAAQQVVRWLPHRFRRSGHSLDWSASRRGKRSWQGRGSERVRRWSEMGYRSLLDLVLPLTCARCQAPLIQGDRSPGSDRLDRLWCQRCWADLGLASLANRGSQQRITQHPSEGESEVPEGGVRRSLKARIAQQCPRCARSLSGVEAQALVAQPPERSEQGNRAASEQPHFVRESAVEPVAKPACRQCRDREWPFDTVVAVGDYHGALRRWVIDAKHSSDPPLVAALAQLLVAALQARHATRKWDRIIPVPARGRWAFAVPAPLSLLMFLIERWMYAGRGRLPIHLAERISLMLGLPLCANLVQYQRFTRKQGKLDQRSRWRNVAGAMRVVAWRCWLHRTSSVLLTRARRLAAHCLTRSSPTRLTDDLLPSVWRPLEGESILVVDDVMTTGATLCELTRVLRELGAQRVDVVVIARATSSR